jgi:Lanthionine-containing peptide SapB precursor RamS
MALLDLQSMEEPEESSNAPAAKSASSKGCNNNSNLSLLLC